MWQYTPYTPYLQHHGILGQKWGVRRFQNYDGTRIKNSSAENERFKDIPNMSDEELYHLIDSGKDFEVPAGSHLYRSSFYPNEKLKDSTYMSLSPKDKSIYELTILKEGDPDHHKTSELTNAEYEAPSSMKIAGMRTSLDLFAEAWTKTKYDKPVNDYQKYGKEYATEVIKHLKPLTGSEFRYRAFTSGTYYNFDMFSNHFTDEVKTKFRESAIKKGYSGIIDPMDGVNNYARVPVVMFNAQTYKKVLEERPYANDTRSLRDVKFDLYNKGVDVEDLKKY